MFFFSKALQRVGVEAESIFLNYKLSVLLPPVDEFDRDILLWLAVIISMQSKVGMKASFCQDRKIPRTFRKQTKHEF